VFDFLFHRGKKTLAFDVASVTDRGLVRRDNQDAHLCDAAHRVWCVADGMGGGQGGALASAWTCAALADAVAVAQALRPMARSIDAALQSANDRIRSHMREQGYKMMGTTVALVAVDQANPFRALTCHAGDSRIYRFRQGTLRALTVDHTVGGELGRSFRGSRATETFADRRSPLSHVLTRAVGTEFRVRPTWRRVLMRAGDRLMICSDGVHDMLTDAQIGACLRAARSPQDAVDRLAKAVMAAGAGDNFTIIVLFARAQRDAKVS